MKRPKYFALMTGLILLFLSQGCSFHARLGSVQQSTRSIGKMTSSAIPEKAAVIGTEGGKNQHL